MDDTFVKVADVSEIPPGKIKDVMVDANYIALYNHDGTIYATRDCCTHQAYPLSKGRMRGKYVSCGMHGWEFDVTNGEYQGNPEIKVKCFIVKVENGEVFVKI